jgi:hypothetical protein
LAAPDPFGFLETAINRAADRGLDKTVNGTVAFGCGVLALIYSRNGTVAAQWILTGIGGLATLMGLVSFAIGTFKVPPGVTPPLTAAIEAASKLATAEPAPTALPTER